MQMLPRNSLYVPVLNMKNVIFLNPSTIEVFAVHLRNVSMKVKEIQYTFRQDVAFFDANKTGHLVNRLTADIQEFKSSFKLVISQVWRLPLNLTR